MARVLFFVDLAKVRWSICCFLAKNDRFWGKEFWTTTICSTVFVSTCIQYSLSLYIFLHLYVCMDVYTIIQNLMILYVHFYRAGRHYYFGTPHIGLISSHKARQGQDPSAVVYWALLSDMAQILMKKFSTKRLEFIIKNSNKIYRLAAFAISCCNLLIPPGFVSKLNCEHFDPFRVLIPCIWMFSRRTKAFSVCRPRLGTFSVANHRPSK